MTRVYLAAGVAALAIAAPASARPDHGGGDRHAQTQQGGGRADARQQRSEPRQQMRAERQQAPRMQQRSVERQARADRAPRMERAQPRHIERQAQVDRPHAQQQRIEQRQARIDRAPTRVETRTAGRADRMVARAENRAARIDDRAARIDSRLANRSAIAERRAAAFDRAATTFPVAAKGRATRLIDGCPPGLWMKNNGCLPPGQAAKLIGAPIATAATVAALSAIPQPLQYLYPDTPNYYYRYGDGYLYEVDRKTNLIASLLPLIAGGYVPGQYLPQTYMNSYVPNYYGFNSFYPSSYGTGYGYGYDNLCNRYANGVVYQVDCYTGMIQNVIPLYASGYGVGQMLPSAYSTYNVPYQYRDLYYNTSDYGYWYAPGAIYQYDPSSSLITSVAALMSPGFTVGQQLPAGYNYYNVPYSYRTQYYDTPNAWYRYNNGYIYQVDPATQLVTSIVASILT
jgi:hypothetical protein